MIFYLLCGPQASGKTSWITDFQAIPESSSWRILTSDEYWERCPVSGLRIWRDDEGSPRSWGFDPIPAHIMDKAWVHNYNVLTHAFKEGVPVVFEDSLPKKKDRRKLIHMASAYDYEVSCVCIFPSLAECASRNDQRPDRVPDVILAKTYANFELPTIDEGFDKIEIIRNIYKGYKR